MKNQHLHQQIATMKQSLFDEGILSSSQIQELEELQDKGNPYFVQEIFELFFRDTIRQFDEIDKILIQEQGEQSENRGRLLNRLKGSVVSVGALKMLDEVNKMMQYWDEDDLEGTMAAYEKVKAEQENLKVKVEPYFQQLRQVGSPETAEQPK